MASDPHASSGSRDTPALAIGAARPTPMWMDGLARRLQPLSVCWPPSSADHRSAAVLVLVSEGSDPDLVLTLRSADLEHHGGQVSFPGGGREPGDHAPVDTALREAWEEVGLRSSTVRPLGQLHTRQIPVSQNHVVPVVGVWPGDDPLMVHDTDEVDTILRWTLADLARPDQRVMARHPRGGVGPAWQIQDIFLWGFTAGLVDAVLRLGGWEQPWDATRVVDVPERFLSGRPDRPGRVDHSS